MYSQGKASRRAAADPLPIAGEGGTAHAVTGEGAANRQCNCPANDAAHPPHPSKFSALPSILPPSPTKGGRSAAARREISNKNISKMCIKKPQALDKWKGLRYYGYLVCHNAGNAHKSGFYRYLSISCGFLQEVFFNCNNRTGCITKYSGDFPGVPGEKGRVMSSGNGQGQVLWQNPQKVLSEA